MFIGPSRPRPEARHLAADGRPAAVGGRPSAAPRHRAPTAGRSRLHEPLLAPSRRRARRPPVPDRRHEAPAVPVKLDAEPSEVAPRARVHRSRLAFALSVTLAAVPVVVLDNLSATAETSGPRLEVAARAEGPSSSAPSSTVTTEPPTTTTTAPPTTTTAPSTTTTEVPPTTAAPAAPAVQAVTVAAPPPSPPPPPAPGPYADPNDPATWDRLAQCESSGSWAMNSGNGYYGGLQFSLATWRGVGGAGYPHQASRAEQINRGQILQARAGWGQWPHCSSKLGYR